MDILLVLLTIIIAVYIYLNRSKMHKFTKVAYFLLIFSLLAVTVGSTKFALGLFILCMFMLIIRVFTNRKEICEELGVHKDTKNIPEVKEEIVNEIQQDEIQKDRTQEA